MAELTEVTPEVAREFDNCLEFLEGSFSELEESDRLWGELSREEKNDFLAEWPVVEDRIDDLEELVRQHRVPLDRAERYWNLVNRIDRDRPVLESLQGRP